MSEGGAGCAGDFVVDDYGLGYMDVGEEDWFGSEEPVAVGRRMDDALLKKGQGSKKRGLNDDGKNIFVSLEMVLLLAIKIQHTTLERSATKLHTLGCSPN